MGSFRFKGWNISAVFRKSKIKAGLRSVGEESTGRMRRGMEVGPHTGRIYRRKGGRHQASVNRREREYPARETGSLAKSIGLVLEPMRVRIGTSVPYAKYLRTGTRRMQRRKMSDTALKDSAELSRKYFRGWAGWKRR